MADPTPLGRAVLEALGLTQAELETAAREFIQRRDAGEDITEVPLYRIGQSEPIGYVKTLGR